MILTTTPTIEGRKIVEYKGVVFGEVIVGVNFIKDFAAGLRDIFGGNYIVSPSHEYIQTDIPLENIAVMAEAARE